MSQLTKAQKARLGLFLLVAAVALLGTVGVLVGVNVFQERDEYFVNFGQSVSGLEPGAPVKYQGVAVGRVERVGIDPEDVSRVRVVISLEAGTPIKADTRAELNMQGITGLKFIELAKGSNEARTLKPGSEILAGQSTLDVLTDRAGTIAEKIDLVLANLVVITGDDNQKRLAVILEEAEQASRLANRLLALSSKNIELTIANAKAATDQLPALIMETRDTVMSVKDTIGGWIDPAQVRTMLARVEQAATTLNARISKEELGQAIASYTALADRSTQLVDHADITLLRARDDLLKALDELVTGIENFSDFAQMLRDNPRVLLSGRGVEERELP